MPTWALLRGEYEQRDTPRTSQERHSREAWGGSKTQVHGAGGQKKNECRKKFAAHSSEFISPKPHPEAAANAHSQRPHTESPQGLRDTSRCSNLAKSILHMFFPRKDRSFLLKNNLSMQVSCEGPSAI